MLPRDQDVARVGENARRRPVPDAQISKASDSSDCTRASAINVSRQCTIAADLWQSWLGGNAQQCWQSVPARCNAWAFKTYLTTWAPKPVVATFHARRSSRLRGSRCGPPRPGHRRIDDRGRRGASRGQGRYDHLRRPRAACAAFPRRAGEAFGCRPASSV
jgi:hypothetical protein